MRVLHKGRLLIKGLDRHTWHVFRLDLEGDGADRLWGFSIAHAPEGTMLTTATIWTCKGRMFLRPDDPHMIDLVALDDPSAAALFRLSFECEKL